MLPFLLGIVILAERLVARLVPPDRVAAALLFLLIEPTFLAQSALVSPDIVLVFFYLASAVAILTGRRRWLAVSLCGLGLISLRGMISVVAVFISDLVMERGRTGDSFARTVARVAPAYVPAGLLVVAWLASHAMATGWVGHHASSPWAGSFQLVGPARVFGNLVLVAWRLIDLGRLFLWIAAAGLVFLHYKEGRPLSRGARTALALFLPPLLLLTATVVTRAELTAPRYLLICYLSFSLFVFCLLDVVTSPRTRGILAAALVAGLATGHLWKYPEQIAVGWDSTLGHLPYYGQREKMIRYIKAKGISVESVGSDFPNLASPRITDLGEETWSFHPKDLRSDEYVLYASVFNGFSREELSELETRWFVEKEYRCFASRMTLYRRPGSTSDRETPWPRVGRPS